MTQDPYLVTPKEPIQSVLNEMIQKKIGSAIIAQQGHAQGIFTAIDGLNLLDQALES
jgi:CBS domain-containing protein